MLKKILLTAIACHLLTFALYAQTRTNEPVLRKTAESERELYIRNMTRVRQLAQEKGWPTSYTTPEGRRVILVGVDMFGLPLYTGTDNNSVAATTVGANQLWNGGVSGLNLSGSSNSVVNKMALWDGGRVLLTHQELAGRVTLRDASPNNSDHSTHVAGTMIATGINANAKGMAYGAQGIYSYDYDNHLSEMSGEAANLLLSNHSYGTLAGWQFNNSRWEFYGAPGDNEDYKFGYYSFDAQMFDSIAYNAPYYLIVKSAGNNRNENGPSVGSDYWRLNSSGQMVNAGPRPPGISSNNGYDIISTYGTAKNILTVGAVNGIPAGYNNVNDVVMSSFSSWGPTDDGRIKPDVVADGVNVTSTVATSSTSYGTMSGTSMASPNATGALLLLQEYYAQLHGGAFMRSSTLKALAVHTANEAGAGNGPDYKHGWGLLNVAKAADVIKSNNLATHQIFENVLNNGQTFTMNISPSGPVTATLVWTDPKGTVSTSNVLNNTTRKLVHDLDIRIIEQGGSTYKPWILDPSNPDAAATTGDNDRDNVEKINIYNFTPGISYTVQITHKGTLARGSQAYSLVLSGVNGLSFCASAPTSTSGARIDSVGFGTINKLNTGTCTGYTDYSSITTSVQPSQTLPITVRVNSCDATTNNKIVKVFIDFNNNGNFNDPGENVATSPVIAGNGIFSGNITIPSTVIIGNPTIMRVVVVETSNAGDVNPCGSYGAGETQDYKLIFTVPANDMSVENIVSPAANGCSNGLQHVTVRLKNAGTVPRSNIPLTLVVKNGSTTVATVNETYKGSLLPNESKLYTFQSPFNAAAGITYSVNAYIADPLEQSTLNDTLVNNIAIAAASSAPAGQGRICGSNAILLVENPVTSNYFWYTNLNGDPIGVGIGLNTTNIPANNTYFVTTGARSSAGLPTKAAFPNGGGYLSNTNHFMKYTSSTPLYLETVKLYSKFGGKVELIVADITNESGTTFTYNTLSSTVIDVLTSSPNPGPGDQPGYDAADTGAIYHVNLFLPSGSHALIVKTQGSTNLFRNNNLTGNPYPMSKPGLISFTSNNAVSEGGTSQDYYYFLYDMRIRTSECMSNQGTIVATVAPTPTISQSGASLVSSISTGNQWYLNGNAIAGAAGSTFNPTQGGAYTVTVTDNFGCQRTSAAFSWWPTSTGVVNDPEFNLNVFPNPNPGAFVVRFRASKRENVTLELLNVQGQTIQVKTFQNVLGDFSEQMELKNAAAGVYMLRIRYGASVFFRKIVIE